MWSALWIQQQYKQETWQVSISECYNKKNPKGENNKANPTEILQSNGSPVWEIVLSVDVEGYILPEFDVEGYKSNSGSRDEIPEWCQGLFEIG